MSGVEDVINSAHLKVVTIAESNLRDVPASLRGLADDIEKGTYGDVTTLAVVLLGDKLEIFSFGPESQSTDVALLFNAGILRFAREVEGYGQEDEA